MEKTTLKITTRSARPTGKPVGNATRLDIWPYVVSKRLKVKTTTSTGKSEKSVKQEHQMKM